MLELVTFTGVDEQTDLKTLRLIAEEFPRAEFAALAGSRTGTDDPEYPGRTTLQLLGTMGKKEVRTAIHLCGRLARTIVQEDQVPDEITEICEGFGRVQINLEEEWFSPELRGKTQAGVTKLADNIRADRVILQHREEWNTVPISHPRVEYLFDQSGGQGIASMQHWPAPPRGMRTGYAGGIGLDNIEAALEFVSSYPGTRLWLDMQRKLRDENNLFDTEKVRKICQAAFR